MAENGQQISESTITIKKDAFYLAVIALLSGLLMLSVFTQGFGLYKAGSQAPIQGQLGAPQPDAQGGQPEAGLPSQPSAPAGAAGSISSLVGDDMRLGSDSAPVVLVEFSDFQCPFCRKFWTETLPSIKKDYIDTGKVQFVYRDFPLGFHPAAIPSAQAAECAREQGKGWEMHDKIFQEQSKLGQGTVQFTPDDIKSWAGQISGLDAARFGECLDSGKYSQEVQSDLNDGVAAGVQGTPAFYMGKRDGGGVVPISGAQPYGVFKSAIDGFLQ